MTPGITPAHGLSHVKGDETRPLIEATIPAFLKECVKRHGGRPGFVFAEAGIRWTFAEFAAEVDRFAAGLLALGLDKGDRIGIWSPNRPEWVIAQFATARIGLILVNVNPAYRTSELEYALNKVGAKALIFADRFKTSDYAAMLQEIAPEMANAEPGRLHAAKAPALRTLIQCGGTTAPGCFAFADITAKGTADNIARLDAISDGLDRNDAINIQFTSGTTGAPKGATLTHRNVVNNGVSTARAMKLAPGDALCIPVPLYHCFGMVLGVMAAVAYGVKIVFPGEAFDPGPTLQAIDEESCTAVHGVPTMFGAMLDHPDFGTFNVSSLRTGIMAGSPCPEPLMRRVIADMGCAEVTIAYGMTETSPVSFQSSTHDSVAHRVSTVGRIQPHCEAKVVDEAGQTLPIGQTGELWTRGYLVMKGYWEDEARTSEAIVDGWMRTGDQAVIDADGYCQIVGRIKDMIIRGGENVYPAEVESFLMGHPDIATAQVFGVPDEKFGEAVACWIIPKPDATLTAEDVRAHCQGKIAHYKIPRDIRFVEEVPMTVTGKPQKFVMQQAEAKGRV